MPLPIELFRSGAGSLLAPTYILLLTLGGLRVADFLYRSAPMARPLAIDEALYDGRFGVLLEFAPETEPDAPPKAVIFVPKHHTRASPDAVW